MGKACKFCGVAYTALGRRHTCSYALFEKLCICGRRHGGPRCIAKSKATVREDCWDVPVWSGGYQHLYQGGQVIQTREAA